MKAIRRSTRFRRDLKRSKRRGHDLNRLAAVIDVLAGDGTLPARYRDHALTGDWIGTRECHIAPDWLLIYELTDDKLVLQRTGTHADLFE